MSEQPDPLSRDRKPGEPTDEIVTRTAGDGLRVALTFDDGPDPRHTPMILDLLGLGGHRATFCLMGSKAKEHPKLVRRIADAGHALANHSWSHPRLVACTPERVQTEIADANKAIADAAGALPGYFRSPYGGWSGMIRATAMEHGLQPLDWSVNTFDWATPGVPYILRVIERDLRPQGVVLLHDSAPEPDADRAQTVEAVRRLIPLLTARGYHFDVPALPGI
jgi:peptidoglycan-N-acetylglucosamine deacetylase